MLIVEFQQVEFLLHEESDKIITKIEEVIQYTYEKYVSKKTSNLEMSIIFTNNTEIKEINAEYRNKDVATDVISFAFLDSDDEITYQEEMPQILGEVFISVEKAQAQAEEYGHSFEREIVFLALHGFLHLLGYDHLEETDAKEMFGLQEEILNDLQIYR